MNGIGDSVINLPALRALTAAFENRLTLITSDHPYVHVFSELAIEKDKWIRVHEKLVDGRGRLFDVDNVLAQLPGEYDLFISLNPWHSESLGDLLRRVKPKWSIGFHQDFDEQMALDYNKHSACLPFDIVHRFFPESHLADYLAPMRFDDQTMKAVSEMIGYLPPSAKVLALHNDTLPQKCWIVDRFCKVVEDFLREHPEYVCFTFGGAQLPLEHSVFNDRIFQPRCLLLRFVQCMVANADLFVGVDSCMLHVADFARVPSVGLFGPTDPREFGFIAAPNVTLRGRTMEDIQSAEVLEALERMCLQHSQSVTTYA
jgi:ADP-heptose:LPS heptosyltransferase